MWKELRKLRPYNIFRRQHIINNFIADFVCLQKGLIVEIDGDIHASQIEKDKERTLILKEKGFTVIRFKNGDVDNNLKFILSEIEKLLKLLPDRKLL